VTPLRDVLRSFALSAAATKPQNGALETPRFELEPSTMNLSPTRFSLLLTALLPLSAVACGGSDSTSSDPVATTALTGMIDGKAFTAKAAIGTVFDPMSGKRSITISGDAISCANSNINGAAVLTSVAWKEGTAIPFDLQNNATLAFPKGDTIQNDVAISGRIEVIKAPTTVGAKGQIRIRAMIDDSNHVEGQVDVEICPDF
jgi:hypothetical protein